MSNLSEQLQSLRLSRELRSGPPEELDRYLSAKVLPFLASAATSKLAQGSDILADLDPFQDTLSFLVALLAQIQAAAPRSKNSHVPPSFMPGGEIWQKIRRFVDGFDPLQIRYAGSSWLDLIDMINNVGQFGRADQVSATAILAGAMMRLDPACGTFTSTHLALVRLCLATRTYNDALPILSRDIHSLPRKSSTSGLPACAYHHISSDYITLGSGLTDKVTGEDVLEYYLLGAMIYVAVKEWSRAQYFLEHVLSTPTSNTANGIMLEAYKKWILVGVLKTGKYPTSPKAANTNALKTMRSATKAYETIANAFDNGDRKKLDAEIYEAHDIFAEDGNLGLIKHLAEQYQKKSVTKLGDIYAAVTLDRVAAECGAHVDQIAEYLRNLIDNNQLQASIETNANGIRVLRFSSTAKAGALEAQSRNRLLEQRQRIDTLTVHVSEVDRRLSLSKEYLEFSRIKRRRDGGEETDELVDMSFAGSMAQEEDENMMIDVG